MLDSPYVRTYSAARLTSILARLAIVAVVAVVSLPRVASAHGAPDKGAEWLMADWMLLVFLVFFVAALAGFVVALRRGMLSNLEAAKYHILEIHEPDYYTPDWAREDVP